MKIYAVYYTETGRLGVKNLGNFLKREEALAVFNRKAEEVRADLVLGGFEYDEKRPSENDLMLGVIEPCDDEAYSEVIAIWISKERL